MEPFLMTLVIPMFGIFGALGGLVKNLLANKGVAPPVGGILPTVAQLFQQRTKVKRGGNQQSGSTPSSTGDMGNPSDLLQKLLEAQSNNPSWTGRQSLGREPVQRDNIWSKIIEEVVRKQRGG